jgi:hypothetical protein
MLVSRMKVNKAVLRTLMNQTEKKVHQGNTFGLTGLGFKLNMVGE